MLSSSLGYLFPVHLQVIFWWLLLTEKFIISPIRVHRSNKATWERAVVYSSQRIHILYEFTLFGSKCKGEERQLRTEEMPRGPSHWLNFKMHVYLPWLGNFIHLQRSILPMSLVDVHQQRRWMQIILQFYLGLKSGLEGASYSHVTTLWSISTIHFLYTTQAFPKRQLAFNIFTVDTSELLTP